MSEYMTNKELAEAYYKNSTPFNPFADQTYRRFSRIIRQCEINIHEFYEENDNSLLHLNAKGIGPLTKKALEKILNPPQEAELDSKALEALDRLDDIDPFGWAKTLRI